MSATSTKNAASNAPPVMSGFYRGCRLAAQMLFNYVMRGRVFGTHHVPRTGGVLLLSNHQSFLDPVLATLAIPRECHFMARDTLFGKPGFDWLIRRLNAFAVKRGTADLKAVRETLRRLKDGNVVLAFPEGTRTEDGRVGQLRSGAVLIARKARVPVVPTLILGAFEAWPRTSKLPYMQPVVVAYDRPLYPHLLPDVSDDALSAQVRERIVALQQRYATHPILGRTRLQQRLWAAGLG